VRGLARNPAPEAVIPRTEKSRIPHGIRYRKQSSLESKRAGFRTLDVRGATRPRPDQVARRLERGSHRRADKAGAGLWRVARAGPTCIRGHSASSPVVVACHACPTRLRGHGRLRSHRLARYAGILDAIRHRVPEPPSRCRPFKAARRRSPPRANLAGGTRRIPPLRSRARSRPCGSPIRRTACRRAGRLPDRRRTHRARSPCARRTRAA
jgi:hypothetical protein